MKKRSFTFFLLSLIAGCDNKNNVKQFEAAYQATLNADDPFQALDLFEMQSGGYGRNCDSARAFLFSIWYAPSKDCEARDNAMQEIILKAIEKGSMRALIFLFDPSQKLPGVYPENLDNDVTTKLAERLVKLAEKAPAGRKNTLLLMRAGDVLQSGKYVLQDSRKAADLHVRAWLAGDSYAASKLVGVYSYLKDYRRAYFWEIRSRNLKYDFRSELSSDEIIEIQQLASDSSRSNL